MKDCVKGAGWVFVSTKQGPWIPDHSIVPAAAAPTRKNQLPLPTSRAQERAVAGMMKYLGVSVNSES